MSKRIFLLLIFLSGFIACTDNRSQRESNSKEVICQCIGVSDGDTITVLTRNKKQYKIRLANIDCPERGQPFGKSAKQFTSGFCFGKQVRVLHKGKKDRNGRIIGTVFNQNGECLNKALVEAGLAWHYVKYSDDPLYGQLEASARAAKIGLWNENNPIAPWDWRKMR